MWNPFKKKLIGPERNIVIDLANELEKEGKIKNLETELLRIRKTRLNEKEKQDWYHLFGICAFQNEDHQSALERFSEGLRKYPSNSRLRFSLAQEYIFLGQQEKAFPLFDECMFPNVSREFALAMSRYAYLFSEYERGIIYVEKFFDIYKELRILDDTFIFIRGLPFFSTSWCHLVAHCVLSNNHCLLEEKTNEIVGTCHDYDFEFLKAELKAFVSNNFGALLESLRERLREVKKCKGPAVYTDLKIALFESFSASSFEDATHRISTVDLSDRPDPYLEDIRTLAKAYFASVFENEAEQELVSNFLVNQPMLLMPEDAVSFGLLGYQEKIKPKVALVAANQSLHSDG